MKGSFLSSGPHRQEEKGETVLQINPKSAQDAATSPSKYWFIVDFDGTTAMQDVQVCILDKFSPVDWRQIEDEILATGPKSRQYLPAIYRHWNTPAEVVEKFVDEEMALDPHFPEFAAWCQDQGYPLEIVSDGLDLYVKLMLNKYGLSHIPFRSNEINMTAEGATIRFPYASDDCGKCGNCKLSRVREVKADPAVQVVYVGDGISDECPAAHVDILFAKSSLARYCQEKGIDFLPFRDFSDVLTAMKAGTRKLASLG